MLNYINCRPIADLAQKNGIRNFFPMPLSLVISGGVGEIRTLAGLPL